MEGYVSEQEQVEAIKKWLKENGPPIALGLALGLGAIFGWRYWQAYQRGVAEAASAGFAEVVALVQRDKKGEAEKAAQTLVSERPRSTYAVFAALMLARLAVEKQDYATARQQFTWVIDNSRDEHLTALARTRRARVLLAEGKPQEAWASVQPLATGHTVSAALAELKGDILSAQGKVDEARREYLDAYARLEGAEAEAGALALKLDNLGAAPTAGEGKE